MNMIESARGLNDVVGANAFQRVAFIGLPAGFYQSISNLRGLFLYGLPTNRRRSDPQLCKGKSFSDVIKSKKRSYRVLHAYLTCAVQPEI